MSQVKHLKLTTKSPWDLRLENHGFSYIELDWQGRNIHFNPSTCVPEGDIAVVLSSWKEQLQGLEENLRRKVYCEVVTSPEIQEWLVKQGWPLEKVSTSWSKDGLEISLEAYQPIDAWTPLETLRKGVAVLKRTRTSLMRKMNSRKLPEFAPQIAWITFPSGLQLGHLNCAFHQNQSAELVQTWLQRCKGLTWVIVGVDFEEYSFCSTVFPRIEAEHLLLADVLSDFRKEVGLPTKLLTPLADAIVEQKRGVHLFPTMVTQRFDRQPLI